MDKKGTLVNFKFSVTAGAIFLIFLMFCGSFFMKQRDSEIVPQVPQKMQDFSKVDELPIFNFAIVDMKKIASRSKAGKFIETSIAEINDKSKKDLLELEAKIKNMEESKTSDVESRRAVDDMLVVLYDKVRAERYRISEAYREAVNNLENEIKRVISAVAQEKKIKIVLISDAIVYSNNDCVDMTDEVIERLNTECPEIKVELRKTLKDG